MSIWKYVRLGLGGGIQAIHANRKMKKFLRNKEKYPLCYRENYLRNFLKKLSVHPLRVTYYVTGQENLPKGQVIFYGNHTSNFDPLAFLANSDRDVSFLAKKEIKKFYIISTAMDSLEGSYLDREDLRSEIKVFHHIIDQLSVEKDLSYVVFPEGTRSKGPEFALSTFKPGAFQIATKLNAPIVPFAFYLPARVLDTHYHYHQYPVQLAYGKPIFPEEYQNRTTTEIANEVRSRVASLLEEMRKKDPTLVKQLNRYSDKKTDKVLLYSKAEKS